MDTGLVVPVKSMVQSVAQVHLSNMILGISTETLLSKNAETTSNSPNTKGYEFEYNKN
jgi:hypothetical protein